MIPEARFHGGAIQKVFTGTVRLDPRAAFAWRVNGSSTPVCKLVDARELRPDVWAAIWNYGGVNVDVTDATDGAVGTVAAGDVASLYLFDNGTQAGTWSLRPRTIL